MRRILVTFLTLAAVTAWAAPTKYTLASDTTAVDTTDMLLIQPMAEIKFANPSTSTKPIGALLPPVYSTAPSTSVARKGMLFYDTDTDSLYIWGGAAWKNLSLAQDPKWKLSASDGSPDTALYANAAGQILMPAQPSFSAYVASTYNDVTGDATVDTLLAATEVWDKGGNYTSPLFTAPVTGKYFLHGTVFFNDVASNQLTCELIILTSNRSYTVFYGNPYVVGAATSGYVDLGFSIIADMDANDTACITYSISGGSKVANVYSAALQLSEFSGYLIH